MASRVSESNERQPLCGADALVFVAALSLSLPQTREMTGMAFIDSTPIEVGHLSGQVAQSIPGPSELEQEFDRFYQVPQRLALRSIALAYNSFTF
ncbi:MAG: hypothetical protein AAF609_15555 [Cyanobacteria bacterium P01_C01_bin.120]